MQIIYKGKGVCATRIGHVASGYSIVEKKIVRRIVNVSIVSTKRVKHLQSFRHHKSTFYQYEVRMFSDGFIVYVYSKSMMSQLYVEMVFYSDNEKCGNVEDL